MILAVVKHAPAGAQYLPTLLWCGLIALWLRAAVRKYLRYRDEAASLDELASKFEQEGSMVAIGEGVRADFSGYAAHLRQEAREVRVWKRRHVIACVASPALGVAIAVAINWLTAPAPTAPSASQAAP